MKICNLIFSARNTNEMNNDMSLAVLRVFIGLTMAFGHGLGKLPPPEMLVNGLKSMGLPAAEFFAWAAALAEFIGGILLAIGLLTRPAALSIVITMAVAAFVAHGSDPFSGKEMALLYFFTSLFFMMFGAGRWSVDQMLAKKCK